jgi:hypothetical protein
MREDRPLSRRQARYRAQLKDRLWGEGVPDDQAEEWIALWEAEAARRGLPRNRAYWLAAGDWIDRERGAS